MKHYFLRYWIHPVLNSLQATMEWPKDDCIWSVVDSNFSNCLMFQGDRLIRYVSSLKLLVERNCLKGKSPPKTSFSFLRRNFLRRHLPISLGKCSRWLCATSRVNNWKRFPIVVGNERIRFSLKLNICKFFENNK